MIHSAHEPTGQPSAYRPLGGEDFPDEWPLEGRALFAEAVGGWQGVSKAVAVAAVVGVGLWLTLSQTSRPNDAVAARTGDPVATGSITPR